MKERWKRYIEIGILLLITAWIVKVGNEQETYPQQELQSEQDRQLERGLQSGQELQLGQGLQSSQNYQSGQGQQSGRNYQSGQDLQSSRNYQSGQGLQLGQNLQTEQDQQSEKDSTVQSAETVPQNYLPGMLGDNDDLYRQCLQNLHQGNNMVFAGGYYYFRSQAQSYSLCRTQGAGMSVEVIADQVPGAIYVREDHVYFINVSDNRTLYCVGTDGSGLRQVSDFPMQELVVVEDRIYFRSVYDREYDPFYQLTEEATENDRYLYSMKMDGSDRRLLVPQVCQEFMTDGKHLYYLVYDAIHDASQHYVLYESNLDGTDEKKVFQSKRMWDMLPYEGNIYWVDTDNKQLMRLNARGEKEILATNTWRFTISDGQAYVINEKEIRRIDLTTGKDRFLTGKENIQGNGSQEGEDIFPWYYGAYNRGMFLVNGQLFVKYFESDVKGVLWHIWDEKEQEFTIFEDMEPLTAEMLVSDTSWNHGDLLFYYPGREDDGTEQYLDAEEFCYEESYGTMTDDRTYGNFRIILPRFNSKLTSYVQLNQQMDRLMELAMEDKDDFFQEIKETENPEEYCYNWNRYHGYYNCYIGEKYVSMYYYRGGYEGGMRDWRQSIPLIFDRETGALLHMDDLFTVENNFYMKRLTGAVYKYCEMNGMDEWNEAFDNNVLTKNLGDLRYYLTQDGIVLCYERYEITAGAGGSPTFEIPYEWYEDIFR